jgi:Tol biopolymer transport system component
MRQWLFQIFSLLFFSTVWGNAECDQEKISFSNIRQVTFSSMGFEKAGESYFSPDGESIIFQAVPQGEKHYQIYTMDLKVGVPKMVSTGKGACTCGFYRPDGKKILFASSHEAPLNLVKEKRKETSRYHWELTPYMNIYEANLDGSCLNKLTAGAAYHAECSYRSDGQKIVYASNESGSMNLYMCDADGKNASPLTQSKSCYNGGPFFSPQGEWIVFRADRQEKNLLQLFLIRPDGSEERQLTDDGHVNWAPYWHPNGRTIAYTTSKHGHHAYQIYLIDIESGHEFRLTYSSTFEGLPSFSADGNQITWTSKRGGETPQVFVADFVLPPEFT